jgi:thymidine kinase
MLEVITGCMFSGKTNGLIARMGELRAEGKKIAGFKAIQDDRYSKHNIVSHDQLEMEGLAIDEVYEILEVVREEQCDAIAVDEVQFFSWDFIDVIHQLLEEGRHVVLAGVDLDFTGKPFGIIPELMAYADLLTKKNAICRSCGNVASRSQRLVDGMPARSSDPLFITEKYITYEPRCRSCHEVREN